MLDELYPTGTADAAGSRTVRSRAATKDKITQLFLTGSTQGNAPRSKWAAINAIIEYSDWIRPTRQDTQRSDGR